MGKKNIKPFGDKKKGSPVKSGQKGVAPQSKAIGKKPFAGKGKPTAEQKPGRFQKPTENKQLTNGVAKPKGDNKKNKPNQNENGPNKKGGKPPQQKEPQKQKGKPQQEKAKPQQQKEKPQQQKDKPQQQKGKPQEQKVKPQEKSSKPQKQKNKTQEEKGKAPQEQETPQGKKEKQLAKTAAPKQIDNKKLKIKPAVGVLKKNKSKVAVKEELPTATETNEVIKLNKRSKNRLKSEMKKEIILKGKNPIKLTDIKLLEKKLAKLAAKAEPRSKKVQRKMLLIESLLVNVKKENKKAHKVTPDAAGANVKKAKKPKSILSNDTLKANKPTEHVVFVGHLPPDTTSEILQEHFKSAGEITKIRLPVPKRRKQKLFAYLEFADREAKDRALDLHGTVIGDRTIHVMYADKKGGKRTIDRENGKLETKRKATVQLTDKQMIAVGKKLKIKKGKKEIKK